MSDYKELYIFLNKVIKKQNWYSCFFIMNNKYLCNYKTKIKLRTKPNWIFQESDLKKKEISIYLRLYNFIGNFFKLKKKDIKFFKYIDSRINIFNWKYKLVKSIYLCFFLDDFFITFSCDRQTNNFIILSIFAYMSAYKLINKTMYGSLKINQLSSKQNLFLNFQMNGKILYSLSLGEIKKRLFKSKQLKIRSKYNSFYSYFFRNFFNFISIRTWVLDNIILEFKSNCTRRTIWNVISNMKFHFRIWFKNEKKLLSIIKKYILNIFWKKKENDNKQHSFIFINYTNSFVNIITQILKIKNKFNYLFRSFWKKKKYLTLYCIGLQSIINNINIKQYYLINSLNKILKLIRLNKNNQIKKKKTIIMWKKWKKKKSNKLKRIMKKYHKFNKVSSLKFIFLSKLSNSYNEYKKRKNYRYA